MLAHFKNVLGLVAIGQAFLYLYSSIHAASHNKNTPKVTFLMIALSELSLMLILHFSGTDSISWVFQPHPFLQEFRELYRVDTWVRSSPSAEHLPTSNSK